MRPVHVSHWGGESETAWDKHCGAKTPAFAHSQHDNHSHEWPIPVQPHVCVRLRSCFFDITYIFLNEEWYLNRGIRKLTVYYTCVNVFSIYLLLFVYRCVLFFRTSPVFGKVSARSGIVSLFTCVTTVFLLKHKTNLVPSFLPALSSSSCIISLANQYNTSVDAAIVQRRGEWFSRWNVWEWSETVLWSYLGSCCVHGWLGNRWLCVLKPFPYSNIVFHHMNKKTV